MRKAEHLNAERGTGKEESRQVEAMNWNRNAEHLLGKFQ